MESVATGGAGLGGNMRHQPNERTHTHVETANRLLSSCSPETKQKSRFLYLATKITVFSSPANH